MSDVMDYLHRYTTPTPFERALLTGATIKEAIEVAIKEGGGVSVRPWHSVDYRRKTHV